MEDKLNELVGRNVMVLLFTKVYTVSVGHLWGTLDHTETRYLPKWRVATPGYGCVYFGTEQVRDVDEYEDECGTRKVTLVVALTTT